ncbi:hypothetical protein FD754_022243 [Muntiacus muntjak]|uniref:Uncharacterized protein n=1 Tax=Muntiacus muntjak TaxID=9888 RepID=A0A5N3V855_MUNMU|nr:hypothetical protein FD754_022243 [Muntiacus muntjak]
MPMEATLGQCGVKTLTTLEVAGHMVGGKVHCIVYSYLLGIQTFKDNCHFMNVVPTLGKKKGANFNS